ncbi:MAG: hypothetical protein ACJA13_000194 [Paraglaciecola sp.]|jgi:hypothetical protein
MKLTTVNTPLTRPEVLKVSHNQDQADAKKGAGHA